LKHYSPIIRNGPWWHDQTTGLHHFNANRTLHFVVERELDLTSAKEFRFTDHTERCTNNGGIAKCNESFSAEYARPVFVAQAVARNAIDQAARPFAAVANSKEQWCLGWERLERMARTRVREFLGDIKAGSEDSDAIARALLKALGDNEIAGIMRVGSEFASEEDMTSALRDVVLPAFGMRLEDLDICR
jgi:hypothetical protein